MKTRCSVSYIYFLLLFLSFSCTSDGMFEWLFGKEKAGSSDNEAENGKEPIIRFEVLSSDEKFLDFATTLSDLSPLDACYHVVIYQLKKQCGELSEEELGKLSVKLLNCQSEVEHRPIFKCSNSMTLAECTKDMDAVTWNTYQIVGNRARAMCYATQQLQFRRLTEKSVNQLAAATVTQLEAMEELKNGQEHLHTITSETVRRLFESQQELLVTQEKLRSGQADVFASVADNLMQLQQEKSLIASGNQQLAQLAEKIRNELNSTAQLIKKQGAAQQLKNEDILRDLKLIHSQASDALARLDASSHRLLSHHKILQKQQKAVFANLQRINSSVTYVLEAVSNFQSKMENRIAWITQLIGGADDKLDILQCCVLHIAYLLLMMITAAFLHTPLVGRVVLIMVVLSNMAAHLVHNSSLDFAGLTALVASVMMSLWLLRFLKTVGHQRNRGIVGALVARESCPLTPTEVRQLLTTLQRLAETVHVSLGTTETLGNGNVPRDTVLPNTALHHDSTVRTPPTVQNSPGPSGDALQNILRSRFAAGDGRSERSSRASTPSHISDSRYSRSSTPSMTSRCLGRTVAGTQCRLSATPGSDYCRRHFPGS
ncbi:protein brambleberry-like isoform X2 [Pomacea canaliculata]|uniref:protein brambleberry-like isoform X2 n=1 Tax=Pomacea canaliculata TaxID=400727 RepID=UPI000D731B85|nr:protein brambleberry-like isoform X2 [Pomacea canaliculata]